MVRKLLVLLAVLAGSLQLSAQVFTIGTGTTPTTGTTITPYKTFWHDGRAQYGFDLLRLINNVCFHGVCCELDQQKSSRDSNDDLNSQPDKNKFFSKTPRREHAYLA